MIRRVAGLCVGAALAAGCACDPPSPEARAEGFAMFAERVVPILERRCSVGCHGVPLGNWPPTAEGAGEALYFPVDLRTGRIPADRLEVAYARTRDTHHRIEPGADPAFSHLLRVPLADALGGLSHGGVDVFADPADPDLRTLAEWVAVESPTLPPDPAPPPEEAFFRDHVLGVFVRNGCFLAGCHGLDAFNDLKLMPPLPRADAALDPAAGFSPRMVRHNRRQALGDVTRLANLGGDLRLSRLITKALPVEAGGVHHRGGNGQFFEGLDDPDVDVLLTWLDLERKATIGRLTSSGEPIAQAPGALRGIAFIRGPRHAPRRFFELEPFHPGSAIWLLPVEAGTAPEESDAQPHALTRGLFDGPIEVQGLDVRYDGRAIAFSIRRSASEGFRIYELGLDARLRPVPGSLRRLSDGPPTLPDGAMVHHLDPLYAPGPGDLYALDDVALVYASNEAGDWAATLPDGFVGEADGGTASVLVDAQRTEAPGTFTGRGIAFVDGPHAGERRTIVAHEGDPESAVGARLVLDAPLSAPPDRRTVYVIEAGEARPAPVFDLWRLIPGRPGSARRMTFTGAPVRRPTLRTTGEVMFTSVRNSGHQGGRPVYNGAIYRVMAGGFDYHIQGGNRSRYPLFVDSRELPQGLEVRLASDPRNLWGGGLLVLADHGLGVHVEPDNPMDRHAVGTDDAFGSASQRFLPTALPLSAETGAEAVTHTGRSPGGAFRDPYPLPDGTLLVARATHPLDHLDDHADPDWDLHRLRFDEGLQDPEGRRPGAVRAVRLDAASTPDHAEHTPRPVMVRLKEPPHPHQKFAPREDATEPQDVDGVLRMPSDAPGLVECYDYPLLQSFLTDFTPIGARDFREEEAPPHQRLRSVRVMARQPAGRQDAAPLPGTDPFATRAGLGAHAPAWIVDEIPLEPDGSFQAVVPAEVPLKIQGLNADGMAVHSMSRWFYVHPGEKLTFAIPRSVFPLRCAGCHGALTGDRIDALGPPDGYTSASRVMANWDARRARRRPSRAANAASVDFRRDVQPILDRKCVRCHGAGAALDLRGEPTEHYSVAYESLLAREEGGGPAERRYVAERASLSVASHLIEKLTGRELEAPRPLDRPGAPHPAEDPLDGEELRTLIRWIDLGATFRGPTFRGSPSSRSTP